jgi:integrase
MKTEVLPLTITEMGVSARIRLNSKTKAGRRYDSYVVEYILLGKRKQVWRADLEKAKAAAHDACIKIANGNQSALEFKDTDRMAFLRATEAASKVNVPIDTACREYADAIQILGGKVSVSEACRDWAKRNAVTLPKVTIAAAVEQVQQRAVTDCKSKARQHELEILLNRFSESFQCDAHTITPGMISSYLTNLPLGERSKRNYRDVISHLNRWLILHGYLAKGTDWMDGVQKYSKRKFGAVEIYTPEEMKLILAKAGKKLVPFVAVAAFSALRHSEIKRLEWQQVELSDKAGESFIEVLPVAGTKSDQRRRLVPVKDNLKAWLMPYRQKSGKVCPVNCTSTLLPRIVKSAKVQWKKNAFRHSGISYRIAESGDIARVADESGNSVQVIRSNYLRRVKPSAAAEWFSIMPPKKARTRKLVITR